MRAVVLACVIFAVVIALAVLGLPVRTQVHDAMPARVETRGPKSVRVQVQNTPTAKGDKGEPGAARKAGRESANHKIEVVGEPHVSPADAQLDALVRAQMELEKYLRTLNPPVYWKPPLDYIRHNLVKDMPDPVAVPLKDAANQDFINSQENGANGLKRYVLAFEVTPAARREMLYLARQDRSQDRLLLLLPVLGGFVLVLLAGAAYINLDERSKGYYTTWLRLAAGGAVVAAVGSGWWWFRHGAVE